MEYIFLPATLPFLVLPSLDNVQILHKGFSTRAKRKLLDHLPFQIRDLRAWNETLVGNLKTGPQLLNYSHFF